LKQKRYPNFDRPLEWYDLDSVPEQVPLRDIELLLIEPDPHASSKPATYPAAPELFPRLSPDAHIFLQRRAALDGKGRKADPKDWRQLYPDLGIRSTGRRNNIVEMFFLDRKIVEFMPDPSAIESADGGAGAARVA
jgi:hypothetical protein